LRSLPALTARDTSRLIVVSDTNASGISSIALATEISGINGPPDARIRNIF